MKIYLHSFLTMYLLFLFVGCKPAEVTVPNTDNNNPAQSNGLIKSVRIVGDVAERTQFKYMLNSSDGHCYYHLPNATNVTIFEVVVGATSGSTKSATSGEANKINDEIGKIRYDGTKLWNRYAGISVRGMTSIPTGGGLLNDALVVGGFNKNNGSISIFSNTGQPISNKEFSKVNSSVWFNSIKTLESNIAYTYFIAAGGVKDTINNLSYPYLVKIQLNNTNYSISIVAETIFNNLSGQRFSSIELISENGSQNIITTTNNTDDSKIGVCKLNSSYTIIWKKEIIETNTKCSTWYLSKIIYENGKLYVVCGDTDDNEKGTPSNGGKWNSCLLVCLDITGNILWQKKISNSKYDDYARQVLKYGNNLFVIGGQSGYFHYESGKVIYNRSNGFISKVDATSGNVLINYTFGDKSTASGFVNGVFIGTDKLLLGGYVNYNTVTELYQGWLVGFFLSDL